eukprot:6188935-Pleurochrysis_carterae.AAC.2
MARAAWRPLPLPGACGSARFGGARCQTGLAVFERVQRITGRVLLARFLGPRAERFMTSSASPTISKLRSPSLYARSRIPEIFMTQLDLLRESSSED